MFISSFYKLRKGIYLLELLFMAVVLGFRSKSVGIDTATYIDYYNSLPMDIFSGYMEKGWNSFAVLCKVFNISAYGFHFLVAFFTLFSYYSVSLSLGNPKATGFVMYFLYSLGFFFLMFNGMRQFLAISFLLLGYSSLVKGNVFKFIVFVVFASFIHYSSICAFLILLIRNIDLTTKRVVSILLLSFVLGIFLNEVFFSAIAGKYISNVEDYGLRSGFIYTLTVGLLTNLFFIWLYMSEPSLSNNMWVKFNIFSVISLNIMSNLVIGPRIVYIFSVTSIIALSLYASQRSNNKILKPIIYIYSVIMFIRFLIPEITSIGSDGCLIPYEMNFHFFDE